MTHEISHESRNQTRIPGTERETRSTFKEPQTTCSIESRSSLSELSREGARAAAHSRRCGDCGPGLPVRGERLSPSGALDRGRCLAVHDMGKSKKETEREIELIREAAKQDTAGGGCWKVVACIVCGIIIYSGTQVAMFVAQAANEDQQLMDERF